MEKTATPYGENGYTLWSVCICSIGCSGRLFFERGRKNGRKIRRGFLCCG